MWQAKTIKKIVKCEPLQLLCSREENQWCFMGWFIDLPLLWLQANHPLVLTEKVAKRWFSVMIHTRDQDWSLCCESHTSFHFILRTTAFFSLLCCLWSHQFYVLVVCQITCKLSTGPRWWSMRGPCPTRQQTPSHGSGSCWPTERLFRPSCWSVWFHHTNGSCSSVLVLFGFYCFSNLFFRLVQMDQTQWWGGNWGYPQSSGIMTSLLWLLFCTYQRWVSYSTYANSITLDALL